MQFIIIGFANNVSNCYTAKMIKIIGQINEQSYKQFSEDLDAALFDNVSPICIELHSEGGNSQDALAFYGKIRNCSLPISVTAHGIVHSSAILVLVAADQRMATSECQFLVHDSRESFKNMSLDDLLCAVERVEREEKQWAELLEARTVTPWQVWRQMSRKETYLDAKEALQFGLINKILKGKKV